MTITIDKLNHLGKDPPLPCSLIRETYSVYDVDLLAANRAGDEPLQRLEAAQIIGVHLTGEENSKYKGVICKLFIASPVDFDVTNIYAVSADGRADVFDDVYSNSLKAFEDAVKKAGGNITLEEDEWPEMPDYLAALAKALGKDNIAIHRWKR